MSRTLILIRHAKSSWDSPAHDHDRSLNDRGRLSAPLIGDWLRKANATPDAILCSSAKRTVETCERLGFPQIPVTLLPELYLASAEEILRQIRQAEGKTIALIGHNPGIGDLANRLAPGPASHPRFYDYPTCATALFDFDISSWSEIGSKASALRDFVVPRDLA